MGIVTNENVRQERIDAEVDNAVKQCQRAADNGDKYIQFETDKSIYREVRRKLEAEHDIFVPMMVYCGLNSKPSHLQIEHYGDDTTMKLKWR